MILGIGTDIVQIPRIEKLLVDYQDSFPKRILSSIEIEKFNNLEKSNKANFLAKRFAAKEAIGKALGIGINTQISFKDILIHNDKYGKPYAEINANIISGKDIFLSISDDYPVAVAFAIISQ